MTKAEAVNLFEGFNGRPPSDSELSKLDIIFRPHRDEPKLKSRIRKGTGRGGWYWYELFYDSDDSDRRAVCMSTASFATQQEAQEALDAFIAAIQAS